MHPTPLPGDGSPAVHVSLRLDAPVAAALAADGRLREAAAEGVRHSIGEVVARLGVPGTVAVDLDPQPGPDDHRPDLLALTVNGRSCHFSDDVLVLARSYAVAEFAAGTPADAAQWARRAAGSASSGDQERFVEFLASVCAEAVSRQASVLLGPAQVGAYQQQLGGLAADLALGGASLDARRLRPILARLLDLRISVADRATVARVLALGANAPWEDVAEELVDALAPPAVELLVPPEYVAALTASSPGEANLVDYVREGVYDTLGVVVPQVRVAAADALKSNSFRLVINHLPGQPVVGLGPGELVVNAAPEHLESGDGAVRPAVLPGTPYPAAVVRATVKHALEARGLTTWDAVGHCVLCVAESLRQSAASLLPRRTVRARVQQLAPLYPALVKRARATVSDEQVTRIVRALVAERVPVHDLRTVLERLCDSEFGTADAGRGLILGDRTYDVYGVGEEPPEDAVSFVRSGLTRQIAGAAARGTRTLVVYLLDPALERPFESVGDDEPPSDGMADTLLAALTRELAYLPPTALVPCLLTAGRARAGVRAAIKHRYPRVSVVAHEELPADLNVQPVARISAS